MKRFSKIIVSFVLTCVFLSACTARANYRGQSTPTRVIPAANATLRANTILIGTDATFPPFESLDMDKQELTGFDIELIRAVAAKAGLEVKFFNFGINQLLAGLARCQYDGGISAIPISDVLKQQMNFSDPYFTVGQVMVVKQGNIKITGRDQLSGMLVGAQGGSPAANEILKIPGAQLKSYDSVDLVFRDLITGYIDAVIVDVPRAQSYANIKANKLKIVADEFASVSYAVALCNDRTDLLKKINDGLASVKADGTLDRLIKKWNIPKGQ